MVSHIHHTSQVSTFIQHNHSNNNTSNDNNLKDLKDFRDKLRYNDDSTFTLRRPRFPSYNSSLRNSKGSISSISRCCSPIVNSKINDTIIENLFNNSNSTDSILINTPSVHKHNHSHSHNNQDTLQSYLKSCKEKNISLSLNENLIVNSPNSYHSISDIESPTTTSSLSSTSKFDSNYLLDTSNNNNTKRPGLFHNFSSFFRKSSISPSPSISNNTDHSYSTIFHTSNTSFFNNLKAQNIPGLQDIQPVKRVLFASNTYYNDPPQQILGKHPRKGEVEVLSNGSIVIHRLTSKERRDEFINSTNGVVIGGTGRLKYYNNNNSILNNPALLKIDKPMIQHSNNKKLLTDLSKNSQLPNVKIPNDILYTRCCHLREIIPVTSVLNQLEKGSTSPITFLQFRNPLPSIEEIWAFGDFISIAPVLSLSLDSVQLNHKMLHIILSSLIMKKDFYKLSLRNTPLDSKGWKILCSFITDSISLNSLDLTMVPNIKTNVQKASNALLLSNNIQRMKCDLSARCNLNWDLLTASIATKGGLQEIILNGSIISPEEFKNFLDIACINVNRLGLAYSVMTDLHFTFLENWIISSNATGLDLGFINLKGKLKSFTSAIWQKTHRYNNNNGESEFLKFLSLNDTNLEIQKDTNIETSETIQLFAALRYCEDLKFLDLSNNPKLFPHGTRCLIDTLPTFVNLIRLNLDYEMFAESEVLVILSVLPLCKKLSWLSLLGVQITSSIFRALCELLERCHNLITLEIDYDDMSDKYIKEISNRKAANLNKIFTNSNRHNGSISSNKSLVNMAKLYTLLSASIEDKNNYIEMVDRFLVRAVYVKKVLMNTIREMFIIRQKNQLNNFGKEVLIRLCILENCFDKDIKLLEEKRNAAQRDKQDPDQLTSPLSDVSSNHQNTKNTIVFPFSKAKIENTHNVAHQIVPYTDEEKSLFECMVEQQQEKGDVLNFNKISDDTARKEIIHNSTIDRTVLLHAAKYNDSEQIKSLIMESDLSGIVYIVDELETNNYHLFDIFEKKQDKETTPQIKHHSHHHHLEISSSTDTEKASSTKQTNKITRRFKAKEVAFDAVLDDIRRENFSEE